MTLWWAANVGLKQPNHRIKTFFKHYIETKFLIHKFQGQRTHFVYSCIPVNILLYIQQTFCFANCDIKQLTLYMIDFGKPLKL